MTKVSEARLRDVRQGLVEVMNEAEAAEYLGVSRKRMRELRKWAPYIPVRFEYSSGHLIRYWIHGLRPFRARLRRLGMLQGSGRKRDFRADFVAIRRLRPKGNVSVKSVRLSAAVKKSRGRRYLSFK